MLGAQALEQTAGADQALLVGKREDAAVAGGGEARGEAGGADDGRHRPVGGLGGGGGDGLRAGGRLDAAAGEGGLQRAERQRIGGDGDAGPRRRAWSASRATLRAPERATTS
jgi:hypothetical protein